MTSAFPVFLTSIVHSSKRETIAGSRDDAPDTMESWSTGVPQKRFREMNDFALSSAQGISLELVVETKIEREKAS